LSEGCSDNLQNRAVQARSGAAAVNQGMNFNTQKSQKELNYFNGYVDEKLNRVETTAVQQVCDRTFYRRGEQWIDARLITPDTTAASTVEN
jgi:isocitrate dehydrogenase kinase/phosphatase